MLTTTIDESRLNDLLGRFVNDLGAAYQAPLMILGEELGLFEALAETPRSSQELADATGTSERYVREWVRSLAAAGYASYDPETERYFLDAEQALLFDEESPAFILGGFQVAMAAAKSAPRVLAAFRSGEGIGWGEHDEHVACGTARFFGPGYRTHLVAEWIPSLEGVEGRLQAGATVADVGCGHGLSTLLMAEAYPASSFIGFDLHEGSLQSARRDAEQRGLEQRARFLQGTAKSYPGQGYDLVTMFDCLHDLGDPVGAVRHALASLADDGVLMVVEPRAGDRVEENLNPVGRAYYSASTMLCTPSSLSQEVGLALGAQAGEQALRQVLTEGGFKRIRRAAETPFNIVLEARR